MLLDAMRRFPSATFSSWRDFVRDERANVAVVFGLAVPVIIGAGGQAVPSHSQIPLSVAYLSHDSDARSHG